MLTLLPIVHFIGIALGVGAATVKVLLVIKCRSDSTFIPAFFKVAPIMTRQIVAGMILLTLSGIVWILMGYDFSTLLTVKVILVGMIWVLGPIIDNAVEPKLRKLAPAAGETASPEFIRVQNQHLALEIFATLLFYAVLIIWMFH